MNYSCAHDKEMVERWIENPVGERECAYVRVCLGLGLYVCGCVCVCEWEREAEKRERLRGWVLKDGWKLHKVAKKDTTDYQTSYYFFQYSSTPLLNQ